MLRRSKSEGRGRTPERPARVLVTQDDRDALELLRRLLTRGGYEVLGAGSADEALHVAVAEHPDVAVLDLGGTGANLKLLDTLRHHEDPEVAGVRVVLLSRHGDNRLFSWQSGIDAFLPRTFHAADLLAEVAAVLARPDADRPRHRRAELERARVEGGR